MFHFSETTMKTAVVVASLIGSAAAFAPAQKAGRTQSALAAFDGEIGAQPPLGFWYVQLR